jgi:hypothetical protein
MMRTSVPFVALALTTVLAAEVPAATPIANSGTATSLPAYSGTAAPRQRIRAKKPPTNPFMARLGVSNVHNDSWMSDAYWVRGPLGRDPETSSAALAGRICVTITFDRRGRLIATCTATTGPKLIMFDPVTLDQLTSMFLPYVPPPPGQDPFTNSSGGAYFYLDDRDRAVVGTADGHIWIVGQTDPGPGFVIEQDIDLTGVLGDDRITSVLPDWSGRLWFVGRYNGVIGVVDPETGDIQATTLGEEVENSFAIDRDGVYIVSDVAMYRMWAEPGQAPAVVWSEPYDNSGIVKPGQFNAGSGTTPTLMDGGYVAITDNADHMQVVVYRTAATLGAGESRVVCETPVFQAGASATENSLITVNNSLIVENNYGYTVTTATGGVVTTPGVARVDVRPDESGCDVVWTSNERAPSLVPKISTRTGLIYLYTKDPDPVNPTSDAWFWTAIDYRDGHTVWKQLAGTGTGFNNHYAGLVIARRSRTAYLGALGGIVAIRDAD